MTTEKTTARADLLANRAARAAAARMARADLSVAYAARDAIVAKSVATQTSRVDAAAARMANELFNKAR